MPDDKMSWMVGDGEIAQKAVKVYTDHFLLTGIQYDNTHMVTTAETVDRLYCGVCFC